MPLRGFLNSTIVLFLLFVLAAVGIGWAVKWALDHVHSNPFTADLINYVISAGVMWWNWE